MHFDYYFFHIQRKIFLKFGISLYLHDFPRSQSWPIGERPWFGKNDGRRNSGIVPYFVQFNFHNEEKLLFCVKEIVNVSVRLFDKNGDANSCMNAVSSVVIAEVFCYKGRALLSRVHILKISLKFENDRVV